MHPNECINDTRHSNPPNRNLEKPSNQQSQ